MTFSAYADTSNIVFVVGQGEDLVPEVDVEDLEVDLKDPRANQGAIDQGPELGDDDVHGLNLVIESLKDVIKMIKRVQISRKIQMKKRMSRKVNIKMTQKIQKSKR